MLHRATPGKVRDAVLLVEKWVLAVVRSQGADLADGDRPTRKRSGQRLRIAVKNHRHRIDAVVIPKGESLVVRDGQRDQIGRDRVRTVPMVSRRSIAVID